MNEITKIISKILNKDDLTFDEAARAAQIIQKNGASPSQIASYITGLAVKGIKANEIAGTAYSMSHNFKKLSVSDETIFIKSTGVDPFNCKDEFDDILSILPNISLPVASILSIAGLKVVLSSQIQPYILSSTSSILSNYGYNMNLSLDNYAKILEKSSLVFVPEKLFIPKMLDFSFVEKELLFLNIIDFSKPLFSPFDTKYNFSGCCLPELQMEMLNAMKILDIKNACVISSDYKIDKIIPNKKANLFIYSDMGDCKMEILQYISDIFSLNNLENDVTNASRSIDNILRGASNAYFEIVACNAGAALFLCKKVSSFLEGINFAKEILRSGNAYKIIHNMISYQGSFLR